MNKRIFGGFLFILLITLLSGCGGQAQQPDPRLKSFQVIDTRIVISGGQAQVYGEVVNTSSMKFPFDVTMQANLMDQSGNSVGSATGTAEDVGPGQTRQFILLGTVDGTNYAKLTVAPVSLLEKRQELGLPTPTPLSQ